jgi:MFS family permease
VVNGCGGAAPAPPAPSSPFRRATLEDGVARAPGPSARGTHRDRPGLVPDIPAFAAGDQEGLQVSPGVTQLALSLATRSLARARLVGSSGGSLLTTRLPESVGLERKVLAGSVLALAAAAVALGLALGGVWTVWALIGPATFLGMANGLAMPSAQTGAVGAVPRLAGTASGLSGFLGTVIAAVATQVVGMLQNGTPYPIVAAMVLGSGLALVAAAPLARRRPAAAPA